MRDWLQRVMRRWMVSVAGLPWAIAVERDGRMVVVQRHADEQDAQEAWHGVKRAVATVDGPTAAELWCNGEPLKLVARVRAGVEGDGNK